MFCLVEPDFKELNFGSGESLAKVFPRGFREWCRHAFDVEKAFEHTHWKFGSGGIDRPGVFEVAVHMRPAICRSRTVLDDFVEFVCSVGLQNPLEAVQDLLWVNRVLGVRVVVENVGILGVATIHPDEATVSFSETFPDYRKRGGIGLDRATEKDSILHSFYDRTQKIGYGREPATHGCSINWEAHGLESLLLAVEWEMHPKFVGCDVSKKTRSCGAFVDGLIRFLSNHNLSVALCAPVFQHDVLVYSKRLLTNSVCRALSKPMIVRWVPQPGQGSSHSSTRCS